MSQPPNPQQPGGPRRPGQPIPGQPPQGRPPMGQPAPGQGFNGSRPGQVPANPYAGHQQPAQGFGGGGGPGSPYRGGPPQKSNTGKTVLIVLGIVGGVFVLSIAICGLFAYLAVKDFQDNFGQMIEEMQAQSEHQQQAEVEHYVSTYHENPIVKEKIGTITSSEYSEAGYDEDGPYIPTRIEVTGDKGTGHLQIEQTWDEGENEDDEYTETTIAVLVVNDERFVIDDDASSEMQTFDENYVFESDSDTSESEDSAESDEDVE